MANTIKLSIDTDAPYTSEEKENLLDAFLSFISEEDPDVIEGTESVEVINTAEFSSDENVNAKAIELIKSGALSVTVTMSDANGDALFDTGEVPLAL